MNSGTNGKRTRVMLRLRDGKTMEVPGYVCGYVGCALVVHKTPWCKGAWQVTDPETGAVVVNGGDTRRDALELLAGLVRRIANGDPLAFIARMEQGRANFRALNDGVPA